MNFGGTQFSLQEAAMPNLNTEESAALRGVVRRELRKICHMENERQTKEPLGVPSRQCSGENYV